MTSSSACFVKASSDNLPTVNIFMVHTFIKSDDRFNAAEIKGVKACNVHREQYGDNAIGFVEIKREGEISTVRGKVCPKHKIRNKGFTAELVIDEVKEQIQNIQCYDCAASLGGCKYALAFLMWILRRSEEPSPTEITCYWKKPRLAAMPTSKKYVEVKEFLAKNTKLPSNLSNNTEVLKKIMDRAICKEIKSHATRYYSSSCTSPVTLKNNEPKILSLHYLIGLFKDAGGKVVENFVKFAAKEISEDAYLQAQSITVAQNHSSMWHELRYGRITTSKFYEMAMFSK